MLNDYFIPRFFHIFDRLNYLFDFLATKQITMEDKKIRRNLYRVLRKTGIQKQKIKLSTSFNDDLRFDTVDWSIFTYYLEGIFKISINDEDLIKLDNVKNTIQFLGKTA